MLAARFVKKLADARQLVDDRLVFGNFAVENPQRIGHRAALAVGVHSVFHRGKRFTKSLVIFRAVVGTSDGIQL